jgi:uncharacterized protein YaaR (DUF327 family)
MRAVNKQRELGHSHEAAPKPPIVARPDPARVQLPRAEQSRLSFNADLRATADYGRYTLSPPDRQLTLGQLKARRDPSAPNGKKPLDGPPKLMNRVWVGLATLKRRVNQNEVQSPEALLHAALSENPPADLVAKLVALDEADLREALTEALTVRELQSLYQKLEAMQAGTRPPDGLSKILGMVDKLLAQASPALSPELRKQFVSAVKKSQGPEQYINAYFGAHQTAGALLPPDRGNEYRDEVITSLITFLLNESMLQNNEVEGLLMALPANALAAMIPLAQDDAPLECVEFLKIARKCANAKGEEARRALASDLSELELAIDPATGHPTDPDAFADHVISAIRNLDVYRSYARSGVGANIESLEAYSSDLRGALGELCKRDNLRRLDLPQLKNLSNAVTGWSARLNQLDHKTALVTIGHHIDAIDDEFDGRRTRDAAAHREMAPRIIAALGRIGPESSLAAVLDVVMTVMEAHANSRVLSKQDLELELDAVVAGLSPDKRQALAKAMQTPQMRELSLALLEMGKTAAIKEQHPALCAQLGRMEYLLHTVRAAAGVPQPVGQIGTLQSLSLNVRGALRLYGIEIGTGENVNVKFGIASRNLQKVVMQKLDKEPAALATMQSFLPRTVRFSVDGRDIESGDNMDGALLELLKGLYKDNPTLLSGLSDRQLHQTLRHAAIQTMGDLWRVISLNQPDSPIRLPDGRPIALVANNSANFEFRRDDKLGLVVICKLKIEDSDQYIVDDPANPIPTESSSAEFTYAIAISLDGIRPAGPLEFRYETHASNAGRLYKLDLDANLVEILAADADPHLLADFQRYSDEIEYSGENLRFVRAIDQLPGKGEEVFEQVRKIVDQFIREETASERINIPANQFREIVKAVDEVPPNHDKIHKLLGVTRAEVVKLMHSDSFARFKKWCDTQDAPNADAEESPRAKGIGTPRKNATVPTGPLGLLSSPSIRPQLLNATAKDLRRRRDSEEDVDLSTFRAQVEAQVNSMSAHQQATLRFNLERVISDDLRGDDYVQCIVEAVKAQDPRAGRMTAEGVLVELRYKDVNFDNGTLVKWFAEGRLSASEVESFLRSLPADQVRTRQKTIATWFDQISEWVGPQVAKGVREDLIAIMGRVLGVAGGAQRKASGPGAEFDMRAQAWMPVALTAKDLTDLESLVDLDRQYQIQYLEDDSHAGQFVSNNARPERVNLLSRLQKRLDAPRPRGWTPMHEERLLKIAGHFRLTAAGPEASSIDIPPPPPEDADHRPTVTDLADNFAAAVSRMSLIQLAPANLPALADLARQFTELESRLQASNDSEFDPSLHYRMSDWRAEIDEQLRPLVASFTEENWSTDDLKELDSVLQIFGVKRNPAAGAATPVRRPAFAAKPKDDLPS